jgi:phosphoinositide-3-kinase, regulatory subunit 4
MKAEKTNFWRGHKRVASKLESPRESVASVRKSGSVIARNKSEE